MTEELYEFNKEAIRDTYRNHLEQTGQRMPVDYVITDAQLQTPSAVEFLHWQGKQSFLHDFPHANTRLLISEVEFYDKIIKVRVTYKEKPVDR